MGVGSHIYVGITWFVNLREEHSLRVFDSRVLRKIFGPKRDKLMGVVEKNT